MDWATRKWMHTSLAFVTVFTILIWVVQTDDASGSTFLEEVNGPYEVTTNGCEVGELLTYEGVCKSLSQVLRENTRASMRIGSVARYIPDCQEDEDYATVHYQDPESVEDVHGVSRKCVNRDTLVMDGINRLILDGTLIWEWDL